MSYKVHLVSIESFHKPNPMKHVHFAGSHVLVLDPCPTPRIGRVTVVAVCSRAPYFILPLLLINDGKWPLFCFCLFSTFCLRLSDTSIVMLLWVLCILSYISSASLVYSSYVTIGPLSLYFFPLGCDEAKWYRVPFPGLAYTPSVPLSWPMILFFVVPKCMSVSTFQWAW